MPVRLAAASAFFFGAWLIGPAILVLSHALSEDAQGEIVRRVPTFFLGEGWVMTN